MASFRECRRFIRFRISLTLIAATNADAASTARHPDHVEQVAIRLDRINR